MKIYILLFTFIFSAFAAFAQKDPCNESQPRPIIGNQHPCAGDIETYCIENDRGYTSFEWDVPRAHAGEPPVGWEILSVSEEGNCVTVRVGEKSGTIKVKVTDPVCGTKVATLPVKPGNSFEVTIAGPETVCIDEEQTYTATINQKQNGNNKSNFSYTWTYPSDWTVVPDGDPNDNQITLIAGMESGTVNVYVEDTANKKDGKGNNGTGVGGTKAYCGTASDAIAVETEDCGQINPLPVELSSFQGKATASGVELTWTTASEKDNDRFEVQRSINGTEFKTIGTVKGAGNSSTTLNYTFADKEAAKGINYYRINQVDFDGTNELSKVIALENNNIQTTAGMSLYPNPATGNNVNISFGGSDMTNKTFVVSITDMNGRKVFEQQFSTTGSDEINLPLNQTSITKGLYMVKVQGDNLLETQKLIVR